MNEGRAPYRGNRRIQVMVLAWMAMTLSAVGCGVKSPPMPLHARPLTTVENLTARASDGEIVLSWKGAVNSSLAGFTVFSSRSDLSQPPCDTCPLTFEKVGTVIVDDPKAGDQVFGYAYAVASGYRYLIKIRPFSTTGSPGPESESVSIPYPKP